MNKKHPMRYVDGCCLLMYLPQCVCTDTYIQIVLNLCIQINKSFINVYVSVCLCFVDFYSLRVIYELRFFTRLRTN